MAYLSILFIFYCKYSIQERDRLFLSRCVVFELIQAIKFKTSLPDENLVLLVQVRWLLDGMPLHRVNSPKN